MSFYYWIEDEDKQITEKNNIRNLMKKEERIKIYNDAKKLWGDEAQLAMALEESLELALAVRKFLREPNHGKLLDMVSEIADVEIMIEQIDYMYSLRDLIDEEKQVKLKRLKQRIKTNSFN